MQIIIYLTYSNIKANDITINKKSLLSKNNSNLSLNPLSPNSDKDQFSLNNIHTLSRDKL